MESLASTHLDRNLDHYLVSLFAEDVPEEKRPDDSHQVKPLLKVKVDKGVVNVLSAARLH